MGPEMLRVDYVRLDADDEPEGKKAKKKKEADLRFEDFHKVSSVGTCGGRGGSTGPRSHRNNGRFSFQLIILLVSYPNCTRTD
ncbi:unnamed protein product [Pleuronectes platessa]|uniref:Uncharacterized protein n=1 Tax=Pleuronectes platessa TaxID=8262 RepID=A0A9N7TSG5_PLEPL|nr:unnamed protein product [Pleuronectes platessa]